MKPNAKLLSMLGFAQLNPTDANTFVSQSGITLTLTLNWLIFKIPAFYEILAPPIGGLEYGDRLIIYLNLDEISLQPSS
jgi:hypothetical protein